MKYYIGFQGTREPHPQSPPNGFDSAALAILWAIQHDIDPVWWSYAEDERDAQPARLGGIA